MPRADDQWEVTRTRTISAFLAAATLLVSATPALAVKYVGQFGYTQLIQAANDHQVRSAVLDDIDGRVQVTLTDGTTHSVAYPASDTQLPELLAKSGAQVTVGTVTGGPANPSAASGGSSSGWALLLPLGLFGLVMAGVVFAATQTRRRERKAAAAPPVEEKPPAVSFTDVAGCDEAVLELSDTLDFLRSPERFEALGAKMPSGIILHGPPGTGKTLLAKAVAGEAGIPFFASSGSDFVEMYVGVGAKRVRELFSRARKSEQGAVVFIDEIDAVARRRAGNATAGSNQESENTLNALLVELDGFSGRRGLICIAATNRLDLLDPALLRPGRFGMQIRVDAPDRDGRLAILRLHAENKPLADDVDLENLADYTAGSTGAQLSDMLNQAAIVAARAEHTAITDEDLREGHLRALAGPERASQSMRDDERKLVAWHEAGHVLAAELCETQDKAQRVTIRARGQAAGLAVYGQTDRALHSRRFVHEQMICILAGRAAEELLVNEISSGAANDLQQVNMLARRAVTEFGFSERLGQLIDRAHGQELRLGDETRRIVDQEVERLVADAYRDALALLSAYRPALDRLAEALIDRGQLERLDIALVVGELPATPARPRRLRPVPAAVARTNSVEELVQTAPEPGRAVAFARWLESRPRLRRRRRVESI